MASHEIWHCPPPPNIVVLTLDTLHSFSRHSTSTETPHSHLQLFPSELLTVSRRLGLLQLHNIDGGDAV